MTNIFTNKRDEDFRTGNNLGRRLVGREIREIANENDFGDTFPNHPNNGDERRYYNNSRDYSYIASFTKGLPHDPTTGEVSPKAYRSLLRALATGDNIDFERIIVGPIGTPTYPDPLPGGLFRLTNPQAGLAFDLEGLDSHSLVIPPAPRLGSAEEASEMAELYWMALCRDINFNDYKGNNTCGTDPGGNTIKSAIDDLTNFSDFSGPRDASGNITRNTIFRGFTPGDLIGPYISQFLLQGSPDGSTSDATDATDPPLLPKDGIIRYGTLRINQRQRTVKPKTDFLTNFQKWREVQDGMDPLSGMSPAGKIGGINSEKGFHFIRNLRDLGNYVHIDDLPQEFVNAALILLHIGPPVTPSESFNKTHYNPGNPYLRSRTQEGFATFGPPHVLSLIPEVTDRALKAARFQKWFVHRRLRPEAFGGLIDNIKSGRANYPINKEILNSPVLGAINNYNQSKGDNTFLLPQAYPEGSPLHPAYTSGHATIAGACVTILKAFFDESVRFKDISGSGVYVPDCDGQKLIDYTGSDKNNVTIGGELNKLASNIALGRNAAGVHWRTDFVYGLLLGEAVAIGILEDQRLTYNENYTFEFTKFDGTPHRVEKK